MYNLLRLKVLPGTRKMLMDDVENPSSLEAHDASNSPQHAHGQLAQRVRGLVFIALGSASIPAAWIVFRLSVVDKYHQPHVCQCLECQHPTMTVNGEMVCAAYPPRHIREAQVSPMFVTTCKVMSPSLALVGLAFAASMLVSGGLWLLGVWPSRSSFRCLHLACRIVPWLIIPLLVLSFFFKFPYGIVPM